MTLPQDGGPPRRSTRGWPVQSGGGDRTPARIEGLSIRFPVLPYVLERVILMAETMGQRVRRAREAMQLTLRAAAALLTVPPSNLSDIENDRRLPSDRVKGLISERLGVPLDELERLDGRLDADIRRWAETQPEVQSLLRKMKDRGIDPAVVSEKLDDEESS